MSKKKFLRQDFWIVSHRCLTKDESPESRHRIRSLVLDEFKRLRLSDEQIYLRSASVNRLNEMIGKNFSCDGSHYIEHNEFFSRLKEFGNTDRCDLEKLAC